MRKHNRMTNGFTLIEILIALVVLTVGLCGIVALFPAGVYSTRESMEDTTAALIAESVYAAVIVALRDAPNSTQAYFVHDGTPQVTGYLFDLPQWTPGQTHPTVAQLVKVPTPNDGTTPPPNNHVFQCAHDLGQGINPIQVACANIKGEPGADPPVAGFDPSEYLDQYSYAFDLIRLGPLGLYEVRIGVYRNYVVSPWHPVSGPGSWGGGQWGPPNALFHECTAACIPTGPGTGHARHPSLKHVFRALVAGP